MSLICSECIHPINFRESGQCIDIWCPCDCYIYPEIEDIWGYQEVENGLD